MADLQDAWKCHKHPSRRSRVGVCPTCLRDRLITLCPNCANSLPCHCLNFPDTDAAPSTSSRLSVDSEPSIHRSKSTAFQSSRFFERPVDDEVNVKTRSTSSFWSVFGIFNKAAKSSAIGRSKSVSLWRSSESESDKRWHFPRPMKVFQHSKASLIKLN